MLHYQKNDNLKLFNCFKNKNLTNLNSRYSKFLVLPLFLFRGNLLENLRLVISKTNKKEKKKFFLCSHLSDYKKIYNVINN